MKRLWKISLWGTIIFPKLLGSPIYITYYVLISLHVFYLSAIQNDYRTFADCVIQRNMQ